MPAPLINTVGCATGTRVGAGHVVAGYRSPSNGKTAVKDVRQGVRDVVKAVTGLAKKKDVKREANDNPAPPTRNKDHPNQWASRGGGPLVCLGLDLQRLVCPPHELRLHALQFGQRGVPCNRLSGIGRHIRLVLNEVEQDQIR